LKNESEHENSDSAVKYEIDNTTNKETEELKPVIEEPKTPESQEEEHDSKVPEVEEEVEPKENGQIAEIIENMDQVKKINEPEEIIEENEKHPQENGRETDHTVHIAEKQAGPKDFSHDLALAADLNANAEGIIGT